MNYRLFLIFLLFYSINLLGQSENTSLDGRVLNFKKPITDAHIYNLNTLEGTSTQTDGTFRIGVRLNDTLIVSHIKYRTLQVIITAKSLKEDSLIIYLDEVTNQLDTVNLKNHSLTGSLNIDSYKAPKIRNMDSMYTNFKKTASMPSFKNYGIDFEKPPMNNVDPTSGAGVTVGMGIGFRFKDLEIRRELKAKTNLPKQIIANFGINYFTQGLKIPEEKIHHFLTYCDYRDIFKLYQKNNIMKVLTILQEESIQYLKIKN